MSDGIEQIRAARRANLVRLLDEMGQAKLHELTGLAPAFLYQMAKGNGANKRHMNDENAALIERKLGWPTGAMSQVEETPAPSVQVSVREEAPAYSIKIPPDDHLDIRAFSAAVGLSDGEEADEYATTHALKFRRESLRRKHLLGADLAVLYGKGDSMLPVIASGDAVLFNRDDTTPRHEELYVVQLPGVGAHDQISVKQAEVIGTMVTFRALNPQGDHHWRTPRLKDDPRRPIDVIGRVCWVGKWV